jgi:hypothetical protein
MRLMGFLCIITEFIGWCFCFATPISIQNTALPDVSGPAAYLATPTAFFSSLSGAAL